MITKLILFITILSTLCNGQQFRFDYTFSEQADGWLKLHQVPAVWNEARLRCHAEGVPLSRLPITWTHSEPNNRENAEGCLIMLTLNNATVADARCDDVFPYVCYKKNTSLAITACGTHDPEYNLDTRTGSCYKFHRRGLTWSRAYMTCAGEGGHLAIINSEQESVVLKELYAKNPDDKIFSKDPGYAAIGFHDWNERGMWMTIHGQTLTQAGYVTFELGQPDNSTRVRTGDVGEFCGSIIRNGKLNDIWCNVIVPFICEKNPTSLSFNAEDSSNADEV